MINIELTFNERLERFYEEVLKRALDSVSNNFLTNTAGWQIKDSQK